MLSFVSFIFRIWKKSFTHHKSMTQENDHFDDDDDVNDS